MKPSVAKAATSWIMSCAFAVLGALASSGCAVQSTTPPDAEPEATTARRTPLHPVAQALAKAGSPTCAPAADRIARFLIGDSQAVALLFPIQANGLISLSLEIALKQGGTAYATLNLSPQPNAGCAASYEVVTHWTAACEQVAKIAYQDLPAERQLLDNIVIHGGNDKNLKVFLLPVGQGQQCLSIKKEMLRP